MVNIDCLWHASVKADALRLRREGRLPPKGRLRQRECERLVKRWRLLSVPEVITSGTNQTVQSLFTTVL